MSHHVVSPFKVYSAGEPAVPWAGSRNWAPAEISPACSPGAQPGMWRLKRNSVSAEVRIKGVLLLFLFSIVALGSTLKFVSLLLNTQDRKRELARGTGQYEGQGSHHDARYGKRDQHRLLWNHSSARETQEPNGLSAGCTGGAGREQSLDVLADFRLVSPEVHFVHLKINPLAVLGTCSLLIGSFFFSHCKKPGSPVKQSAPKLCAQTPYRAAGASFVGSVLVAIAGEEASDPSRTDTGRAGMVLLFSVWGKTAHNLECPQLTPN